jgi:hypothetical protein
MGTRIARPVISLFTPKHFSLLRLPIEDTTCRQGCSRRIISDLDENVQTCNAIPNSKLQANNVDGLLHSRRSNTSVHIGHSEHTDPARTDNVTKPSLHGSHLPFHHPFQGVGFFRAHNRVTHNCDHIYSPSTNRQCAEICEIISDISHAGC